MTKEELLKELNKLKKIHDPERVHGVADDLLLAYINSDAITKAYSTLTRWYA